ncbi:MAG TPA: ribosome silencing factor [Polyangiales bacterium]|nr:ribosome silencing factor [Polyangiales bacterium]
MAAKKSTRVTATKRATKETTDPARELALEIATAALDKKAQDVEIIDVTGKVDYADFVVVMSATSDRQANAIAKNIDIELSRNKHKANSIEGLPQGAWVLMDYGDVVVHIFHEDTRGYYDLEALWYDAERVEIAEQKRA